MKQEDVELDGGYSQRCQNRVELLNFKMEDLRGLGHAGWGM